MSEGQRLGAGGDGSEHEPCAVRGFSKLHALLCFATWLESRMNRRCISEKQSWRGGDGLARHWLARRCHYISRLFQIFSAFGAHFP